MGHWPSCDWSLEDLTFYSEGSGYWLGALIAALLGDPQGAAFLSHAPGPGLVSAR